MLEIGKPAATDLRQQIGKEFQPKLQVYLGELLDSAERIIRARAAFSHLSPLPGKKTPFERAKRFDTTAASPSAAPASYAR